MISTVILTKNEQENIQECIKTLGWCDEVLVIDDNSSDGTPKLAKQLGAKVFPHSLDNDFSKQRNYGLEQARGEWVLFVDADERVSPTLRSQITKAIHDSSNFNGYFLKREDKIWGRILKHGETSKVRLLRLGRKGKGKWEKPVHETWNINGAGLLEAPLLHLPHPSVSEFLTEINFYSTLRAQELYDEGRPSNLFDILSYPLAKFFKNYFLLLGFLDGMPGFVMALFMSLHSFLVRSKLYLLWKHQRLQK